MNQWKYKLSRFVSGYLSTTVIFFMDIFLSVVASGIVALIMVLEYRDIPALGRNAFLLLGISVVASALSFLLSKTYRVVIRHSSIKDIRKFFIALLIKEAIITTAVALIWGFKVSTLAIISIDFFISMTFLMGVRVVMIVVYDDFKKRSYSRRNSIDSFIFGTSEKSVSVATRLSHSPHYNIKGFITDQALKNEINLVELPVYRFESAEQLMTILTRSGIGAIIFAREADAAKQEEIFKMSASHNLKTLIAPTIDEVVNGKLHLSKVRDIKIEDLLGREEIEISMDEIIANFRGKRVMVTGAAGSIGSELCRQLAGFGIKQLVLYDNAETPMHNLRLELAARFPELDFVPIIGDVRLRERIDFAMRTHRPEIVFHAAAYKHVPLMEENPCEAVLVNVFGTRNVADKCIEYGVEKMVMISTDKAVNPTNIMGCTKRLAEIYVQSLGIAIERGNVDGKTKFVTTRFGNVLGSNGSVIPRFREQIERGGPVTVTDKNIIRYFMTIPEACRLVMKAEAMQTENKICIFDMGRPVKIDDLARQMIQLAGFVPDKDIMVEYTGLRPGEKLYEEMLSNEENTIPTTHERIRIAKVREYDYAIATDYVEQLTALAKAVEIPSMVRLMKDIVPEFISKNSEFESLDKK